MARTFASSLSQSGHFSDTFSTGISPTADNLVAFLDSLFEAAPSSPARLAGDIIQALARYIARDHNALEDDDLQLLLAVSIALQHHLFAIRNGKKQPEMHSAKVMVQP